ncbi:Rho termination factor-like protein [Thermovibrio guaymasensis]|uniref:Rho termination factor-like protein n=1 Tax=Thermovibrio guaymasensis TaxID=240167 RepID=A0A420W989_9BACT|nr:Rho termination factor N-terminal domain-containing protein [Thermovibrio guaymasensis]RKQ63896.1 Rho termination factor-like protein [Thermovibrio guaymasensis]
MKSWKLEELKSLKKKEFYSIAKELKIRGRGKMRKSELLEAIAKIFGRTGLALRN